MVLAFLKKWWVESDFKAPNLPLSVRLKGSGCHYTVFITILEQNRWNSCQSSTKFSEVNVKNTFTSHIDKKKYFWHFCWLPYLYTFSLYENASFIIVSAETGYISTRSWYGDKVIKKYLRNMKLSLSGKVPENTHIWLFLLIFHTTVS